MAAPRPSLLTLLAVLATTLVIAGVAALTGPPAEAGAATPQATTTATSRTALARSCSSRAMKLRSRRVARLSGRMASVSRVSSRVGRRVHRLRVKVKRARSTQRRCRLFHRTRSSSCRGQVSFTSFRVGAPSCWRPYAASSPWNRKVSARARLHPRSSQVVSRMLSWGPAQQMRAGHADTEGDYDHPVYFAKASDPVYTLHATQDWGQAEIEGHQIPIPAQARPAAGGDGHMAVVTPDGWEYDLWTVSRKDPRGGVVEFGWGGRTRIDGDGLDSNATAAHFGLAAGIIRGPELQAGKIDHALFMGVKCTDGKASVYPAAPGTGEPCSKEGMADTDAPPLGARFVLDMSPDQIEALSVPRWKKTILHAMAEYGMITGDSFGSGSWGLQMESGSSYTSFGQPDPAAKFAKSVGADEWEGSRLFNLQDGVDWKRHLKLVDPCVSRGAC